MACHMWMPHRISVRDIAVIERQTSEKSCYGDWYWLPFSLLMLAFLLRTGRSLCTIHSLDKFYALTHSALRIFKEHCPEDVSRYDFWERPHPRAAVMMREERRRTIVVPGRSPDSRSWLLRLFELSSFKSCGAQQYQDHNVNGDATRQSGRTVLPYIWYTHRTWTEELQNTLSILPHHPFVFLSVDVGTHRQCRNDFNETIQVAFVGSMSLDGSMWAGTWNVCTINTYYGKLLHVGDEACEIPKIAAVKRCSL